jgi:hypothetical protein
VATLAAVAGVALLNWVRVLSTVIAAALVAGVTAS